MQRTQFVAFRSAKGRSFAERKTTLLLLTGLTALFLFGPSGDGQEKKSPEVVSELYPLKLGHRWTYVGNDGKERISVAVEKQEPIRRKVKTENGGERTEQFESFFLRISSGDKSLQEQMFVAEDGIYRYAAAGKEITPPLKILALPPKKGDSWACDSESETLKLRGTFAVDQAPVSVPHGDHIAWVCTARDFFLGDQKLEATYWFVPNVGIVKQQVKLGKFDLKLELEKFEPAPASPTIAIPAVPLPK